MIWAFTYRLVPPQVADRRRTIRSRLEHVHLAASPRDGTRHGRLVVDERVSQILVLSDSPDLDPEANRRIEAALRALDAEFTLTVPMAVAGDPADTPAVRAPTD